MKLILITFLILFTACGSGSTVNNPGFLSLDFVPAQNFDPNADHGQVSKYKLTITGSALETDMETYYPVDTEAVTLEGFAGGSTIRVMIEAINVNDVCVRRGRSDDISIKGGQNVSASVTVNNVPIFANVRDGATVYNNRFVPKIFAPGAIDFQISDLFNESNSIIVDQISNESVFSISESSDLSILTINAPTLANGTHQLTVKDEDTDESSTIQVTVLDGTRQKGLLTTSGNYLGSLMSPANANEYNLATYFNWQVKESL